MGNLQAAAGWEVKPEGVCRESICVPLPVDRQDGFIREIDGVRRLNLAEFARLIEQPYAHDEAHNVWYFGPAGWEWKERLASQQAPDFTLPDFEGRPHSLADYRGKKIFLCMGLVVKLQTRPAGVAGNAGRAQGQELRGCDRRVRK